MVLADSVWGLRLIGPGFRVGVWVPCRGHLLAIFGADALCISKSKRCCRVLQVCGQEMRKCKDTVDG